MARIGGDHSGSCLVPFVIAVWGFAISTVVVDAVIPSVEVGLRTTDRGSNSVTTSVLLLSQAYYGPSPPIQNNNSDDDSNNSNKRLVSPPDDNYFLCKEPGDAMIDREVLESTKGAWMLVPRGSCTYEYKTWTAQTIYEASGVIVYNTLESRYSFNGTDSSILWPMEYHDYDCTNARAEIPSNNLAFFSSPSEANSKSQNGPYDFRTNDPLLSGDTFDNLCKLHDANDLRNCPSKRCLVAHDYDTTTSDTTTVCCAWDIRLNPYPDVDLENNVTVTIPTLFATMEQGDIFREAMAESSSSLTIGVYSRWRPAYNVSAVLIVLLGAAVAAFASFRSADDYHYGAFKLWKKASRDKSRNAKGSGNSGGRQSERQDTLVPRNNNPLSDESLELEPIHALMFLLMSSISLFVLFFFKIYNVAKVMYAFGCSNSFIQIIVYPLLSRLLCSRFFVSSRMGKHCFRERIVYRSEEFGDITNWHVLAGVIGYSVGMVWLYMALCIPQAGEKYAFYWIAQDVLGTCMCVTFLGIIQLNSIQVASVLLIVAFFYDIFFVFITPYIFKGRSVMIEVATSGGPPKADALWCEKYPSDPDCKGGDPMPMLFSIPRLFDYLGGSSMLGLGDIVLPGLLLSFAARLDASRLVCTLYSACQNQSSRAISPASGSGAGQQDCGVPTPMPVWYALLFGGYGYYFVPLVVSYTIGLIMANLAVYLMEMGQPALLYLVPCTLGTMAYKGWKRNELMSLWNGPKILKQADYVCHGGPSAQTDGSGGEGYSASAGTDEALELQEDFVDEGVEDVVPLIQSTMDSSRGDRLNSE